MNLPEEFQRAPGRGEIFHCGQVSIVGRPNVGKSTLLNFLLGEKVAIVSQVPQTTRNRIRGIYQDKRGQIVFVDTPGLYKGKDALDKLLMKAVLGSIPEADGIIHLVDANESVGWEEERLVENLKDVRVPVVLGLNKIDLKGRYIPKYISLWERVKGQSVQDMKSLVLLPLSGKTGFNQDKLLEILFGFLPEGPALYPPDTISDLPQKIAISDIIREKLLFLLKEEVPHAIATAVETMQHRHRKLIYISAVIYVGRESQKEIVIGKQGQFLKKVGVLARKELEELLESQVFLDLHVKLKKGWRDNPSFLKEIGYGYDI